jgi:acid phosphatase (class A)
MQNAVLPVAAHMTHAVDAVDILPPAPSAEQTAAEGPIVRGPWSDARIAQARADNQLDAFSAFAPVLGERFRPENFPHTRAIFRRMYVPLGASLTIAKNRYQRPRPFMVDSEVTTCITPDDDLRGNGSYPSGHSAFGWGWALILAELSPTHADAILQRGRDFGDSRVVCGVHYPSDVEAGRIIAAAAIARLHADPGFQREMEAARAEFEAPSN